MTRSRECQETFVTSGGLVPCLKAMPCPDHPAGSTAPTLPPSQVEALREKLTPTSGPSFDFLELIRDYAGALMRHPGTRRHEMSLQRVLDAYDALLTDWTADRARIAALEEDAKRYRFIRHHLYLDGNAGSGITEAVTMGWMNVPVTAEYGDDVDAAIDAARTPTPEPTPTERTTDE